MGSQNSAEDPAVEGQRHEWHPRKPESQPVEYGDEAKRFDFDPGFFLHLLDHYFGGRIAHIGPTGWVQPHARISPLNEQKLTLLVADHRPHPPPGCHLPRHAPPDHL